MDQSMHCPYSYLTFSGRGCILFSDSYQAPGDGWLNIRLSSSQPFLVDVDVGENRYRFMSGPVLSDGRSYACAFVPVRFLEQVGMRGVNGGPCPDLGDADFYYSDPEE